MDETGGSGGLIWSSSDEMDGVLPPHNPHTETGSPWENGQIESFNGKLRGEILNLETFDRVLKARVRVERWKRHYNAVRPHSSLAHRPPAPEAIQPWPSGCASLRLQAMVTLT